ncbi:hypothetical protein ACFL5T_04855 [Gemmatimonadota bacterium]
MAEASRWSRFRKSRLFGVLAVYGGAAWVILQIVDILQNSLQLPQWVGAVTLLLLTVGLFVMLATAWVQSHPLTDRREAAEEIPGSWEVDLGDLKGAVTGGRLPHLTWGRAILGGALAFSLLFGFLGLWVVIQDRGKSFAPAEANDGASPAIAVLPFSVSGEGLDEWREGTVNLLSTNLDGAAGLRAIDSRNVLSLWDRHVADGADAERETALQIAEATGARWALLGSAVAIGPRVRLTADVVYLESGKVLGQARAEGPPDSVLTLVDGLTVDVLRTLLGEVDGELQPVSLAAVTTASIPALRAFLEGEAAYRVSDFVTAVEAYDRAVEADSGFALAWHQLASARGWGYTVGDERSTEAHHRAWDLRGRLPERRARLVEVSYGQSVMDTSTIERARVLTRMYPDDPEAWYLLGEAYHHLPPVHLSTPEDRIAAFQTAVALDPSFAPYRIHLVELAFMLGDSASAHEQLEEYQRLAPDDIRAARDVVLFDLAFGDSATHDLAIAGLDTVSNELLDQILEAYLDPRLEEAREAVWAVRRARNKAYNQIPLAFHLGTRGQLRRMWPVLAEVPLPQVVLAFTGFWATLGVPVPADIVALALDLESEDPVVPFDLGPFAAADGYRAILAWSLGRPDDYEACLEALAAAKQRAVGNGDTTFVRHAEALDLLARAHRLRDEEGIEVALPLVRQAYAHEPELAGELGEFLLEAGRPGEAVPYLRYLYSIPWTHYLLAQAYEQEDEPALARDEYEFFVTAWADADPELQGYVEDARASLLRLIEDLD